MRNERYKLALVERPSCQAGENPYEFYDLSTRPLDPVNPLGIDNQPDDLLQLPALTSAQALNFAQLQGSLNAMLGSEPVCPGDGNLDKRVDRKDFVGVQTHKGAPSVFDFNADGITDDADLQIVKDHFGALCY